MSFYHLCVAFTRIWGKFWYKVDYQGLENLPDHGGYILVSNHRSTADPVLIANSLRPQLHFMAKAELFRNKFAGWFLRSAGAFPVERGKGDTGAVAWAIETLKKGGILAMFPEGTRSKTDETLRPKSGAAFIARATGADILPCGIIVTGKKGPRLCITIRFGETIKNADLGFEDASPASIKAATHLVWDRVLKLREEARGEG